MASKPKTAPLPQLTTLADEYGALEKEYSLAVAPFEQKLVRMKALEKILRSACPAKAGDEWIVEGSRFGVRLGPQGYERSIDYKKLLKKISLAAFAKFATCTLTALEKHVPAEIVAEVVSKDQTGARKISTFEKGAATAA